jgi:hypothetical protein
MILELTGKNQYSNISQKSSQSILIKLNVNNELSKNVYVEYMVKHNSVYIVLLKTRFYYIPSYMFRLLHWAIFKLVLRVCYIKLYVYTKLGDLVLHNENMALQYKI